MWMEEKIGTRINLNRVDEAIATGAQEVAVACPFCRVMEYLKLNLQTETLL